MRRLLLSLALTLTLSAVGAGSTLAAAPDGAQKAPIYGPNAGATCENGENPTLKTFGFAILNTPGDETTVTGEVALKHAVPNARYHVTDIESIGGLCQFEVFRSVGSFTTNRKGNGNLYFTVERFPGSTTFFVHVFNTEVPEELGSSAVELD